MNTMRVWVKFFTQGNLFFREGWFERDFDHFSLETAMQFARDCMRKNGCSDRAERGRVQVDAFSVEEGGSGWSRETFFSRDGTMHWHKWCQTW